MSLNYSVYNTGFVLTPEIIKKLIYKPNSYLKKGQTLVGTGAIFFGLLNKRKKQKKSKIPVFYAVLEKDKGELSDLGGSKEEEHYNSIDVLKDEIYEESGKTLHLSVTGHYHLMLNGTLDVTNSCIVMDSLYDPKNKYVHRTFIFDMGKYYTKENGFSPQLFKSNLTKMLKNPNTSKCFLEILSSHHIPVHWNGKYDILKDVSGQVFNVRPRLTRLLYNIDIHKLVDDKGRLLKENVKA